MLTCGELQLRAALFRAIREYFVSQQFLEVDTPIRQAVIIPEANIVPVRAEEEFLQTSPELYMKRLLASGSPKIFQLCRCFRKEVMGRRHLQEFTMLEWYRQGGDYLDLMEDCCQLLRYCIEEICATGSCGDGKLIPLRENTGAVLAMPWQKLTVADAFARWSPLELERCLAEDLFDEILVEHVEPHLGVDAPCFLYDYPGSMASLARKKEGDSGVAERFELYWQGIELANGFSELTDTDEQRRRFEDELAVIRRQRGEEWPMPERFLQDLGQLQECAGIAFGIDRFFMLLLAKDDINDAVPFGPDDR